MAAEPASTVNEPQWVAQAAAREAWMVRLAEDTQMSQELHFRSAVGWSFRAPAILAGAVLVASQWRGPNVVGLLSVGLSMVFMRWLYVSTVYTLTYQGLRVRSGPLNRWADARAIDCVRPTNTILSAPALSLDRLEITGAFGCVVVSPSDKRGFVCALKRIAPQVRLEGGLEALARPDVAEMTT